MPRLGALALQHAGGVFHQRRVEEREPEIPPQRTQDRDVAPRMQVAGVAPFDRLGQARVQADAPQRQQSVRPGARGAVGGGKAAAAAAAEGKEVVGVGYHC